MKIINFKKNIVVDNKDGDKKNPTFFRWSSISSGDQKKIIKRAVSGSNRLQRELYKKA